MSFGETLQLIAGILVVVFGAYYATYIIAGRKNKRIPGTGINVRERFSLSKDKMVCIFEVGGKAYLVVITNGGTTLLDTFNAEVFEGVSDEKQAFSQQQKYEPNGIIARGIWKLWESIKKATSAKTSVVRYERRNDFDVQTNTDDKFDFGHGKAEFTIRRAREEDGIDEIQRRLRNRMAAASDPEEAPIDK